MSGYIKKAKGDLTACTPLELDIPEGERDK